MSSTSKLLIGLFVFAALSVAAGAAVLLYNAPSTEARTVYDQRFINAANKICERELRPLEKARASNSRRLSNEATAKRVDESADDLTKVIAHLKALPIKANDKADVNRWLTNWTNYVAIGHEYADALRENDKDKWADVSSKGDPYSVAVFRFASANDLDSCVMRSSIDTSRSQSAF